MSHEYMRPLLDGAARLGIPLSLEEVARGELPLAATTRKPAPLSPPEAKARDPAEPGR